MSDDPRPAAGTGRDLFEGNLADWHADPERAFDGWLAVHGFGHGTAVVYRAMWGKLLRWSREHGVAPLSWSAAQIGAFLDAEGLHKRHRYRYTRLIERVFHYLSLQQAGLHNPGSQAVRAHLADGDNDPTPFLLPAECDALVARVLAPVTLPDRDATPSPTAWKRARDIAVVAAMLGAGLKVGEVRALRLDSVAADASELRLTRTDNGRTYRAPVFDFARRPLLAWLAVRALSGTLGTLVFPALPAGRPLHAASLYRRVEQLLDEAGVLAGRTERASPQTLRNTYGALHFEAGAEPAAVAQYLGMRDLESGWRLHAAYTAWQARSGQLPAAGGAESPAGLP